MLHEGKVALVTGGASGIGRSAAIGFAREGAAVALVDMSDDGEKVAEELRKDGGEAIFIKANVTSEDDIVRMIETTISEFGGLDVAFNNAGYPGQLNNVVNCTMEEWNKTVDVNMLGVWLCMKHEIPEMKKRGGGAIVNTSSLCGVSGVNNMFAYTGAKHAIVGLTKSAAVDFGQDRIRVNAILPGPTETPMFRAAAGVMGSEPPAEASDSMAVGFLPMGRICQPYEQAEVAIFLCSERASYVSGAIIPIDGGWTAYLSSYAPPDA